MIARVMLVVFVALTLGVLTCLTIYVGAARLGVPHWVAVAVGMVVSSTESFWLARWTRTWTESSSTRGGSR